MFSASCLLLVVMVARQNASARKEFKRPVVFCALIGATASGQTGGYSASWWKLRRNQPKYREEGALSQFRG